MIWEAVMECPRDAEKTNKSSPTNHFAELQLSTAWAHIGRMSNALPRINAKNKVMHLPVPRLLIQALVPTASCGSQMVAAACLQELQCGAAVAAHCNKEAALLPAPVLMQPVQGHLASCWIGCISQLAIMHVVAGM